MLVWKIVLSQLNDTSGGCRGYFRLVKYLGKTDTNFYPYKIVALLLAFVLIEIKLFKKIRHCKSPVLLGSTV